MATKTEATVFRALPSEPDEQPQNYVIFAVPDFLRHRCCRHNLRRILLSSSLLVLCLTIFLLWPTDPDLQLARVRLNHIRVHSSPSLYLDLSLSLTLRVYNRDFFSLSYDSLTVSIGYRGRELGFVESEGGDVKARASSYVNATLLLDGFRVLHDLVYLIEDVASGSVPFDTVSTVKGKFGVLFFKVPIQAKVSCDIYVNPKNQTIIHQNCYPE